MGAQVQREVEGLTPNNKQRPGVQIVFPFGCWWNRGVIERQLLSEVGVVVQRDNALSMLSGYTRATRALAMRARREGGKGEDGAGEESGGESAASDGIRLPLFTALPVV